MALSNVSFNTVLSFGRRWSSFSAEAAWIRASIQTRRLDPPEPGWPRDWPWAVRVQTLGGLTWSCGPTPEAGASPGVAARGGAGPRAKSAQRPQELLRRLALSGGHDAVAMTPLAQVMWPGEGREGRAKALEVTLARLRKLLGCADAVLLQGQQLRLNPARVWLDRVALERLLQRLANPATREPERAALWHEALALWRGPLLAGMTDEGDLAAARDALRRRMAAALLSDADGPAQRSRCLRAVAVDADLAPLLGPSAGRPGRAGRAGRAGASAHRPQAAVHRPDVDSGPVRGGSPCQAMAALMIRLTVK